MTTTFRRAARVAIILAAAAVTLPAPTHAQLGGLKKKVAKAVSGATGDAGAASAETAPAASGARSPYGEYVLEMTDPVLDRFEKGLAAETDRRGEIAAMLAKLPTEEDRAICMQKAAMLPEMQKLLEDYMAAIEKAGNDSNAALKASQEMDTKMRAVYARECGEEVSGERRSELQKEPASLGAKTGEFTDYQYAVIKERITPFCSAGDRLVTDGEGVAVPVDSRNRYVYSKAEIDALRPRCARLAPALAANS